MKSGTTVSNPMEPCYNKHIQHIFLHNKHINVYHIISAAHRFFFTCAALGSGGGGDFSTSPLGPGAAFTHRPLSSSFSGLSYPKGPCIQIDIL